jgi:DNA polymerase-3 subunit epsilon
MGVRFALLAWTAAVSITAIAWVAALCLALWSDLEPAQRELLAALLRPRVALVVLLLILLPVPIGLLLRIWVRAYPKAAAHMRDEVLIIANANSEHRVTPVGAVEMRALGEAINNFAAAHQALRQEVDARIEQANAQLAQEKTRLAALMSELTQGVLVCNRAGRILLYNARASALLGHADAQPDQAAGAPVGLNRSIFGILDKGPIVHALEQVARRIEQQVPHPIAHFVTTRRHGSRSEDGESAAAATAGQLLRAQMVPVQESQGALSGFILIIDDITRAVESDSRRDFLLQQLTEGTRASLASLRAAAETLHGHPAMDATMRSRFVVVIRDEAERLSRQLDEAFKRGGDPLRSPWPREDILAGDLVFALQRNIEAELQMASRLGSDEGNLWLHLDSHAMVQALTQVMRCISASLAVREVVLELSGKGPFARLDIRWDGAPLDPELLHEWEQQVFTLGAQGRPVTLGEVLEQHGAQIWSQSDRAAGRHRLCVQLPRTQPEHHRADASVRSRPVYYDFDLFHQAGQSPAMDEMLLVDLSYTVFDTETTGLAPSDGDEIIAIGAVRIVNGRLLVHECFDRLIKPRRAVRPESQQIHGITQQMLADQPTLKQVLPMFARFAEDTVLVAHNAAFDMRFLELARQRTGVRFDHPVLDTLLLSSVVQPGHHDREHRLEHIASRLGLNVVGRHTALGDAIVTGEVFLKLLPLLAERGIRTLSQARAASQQSAYATLQY